jgi:hypothetical protein
MCAYVLLSGCLADTLYAYLISLTSAHPNAQCTNISDAALAEAFCLIFYLTETPRSAYQKHENGNGKQLQFPLSFSSLNERDIYTTCLPTH